MLRATLARRCVVASSSSTVAAAALSSSSSIVAASAAPPMVASASSVTAAAVVTGWGDWVAGMIGTTAFGMASTALGIVASASVANNPCTLFIACGFAMRMATLPISLFGDRSLSRIACALPQVQVAYQQYQAIANHPRAITWEKKVAAQKMQNDRTRIFREHRTTNVAIMVPHLAASMVTTYLLFGMPAQVAASLVTAYTTAAAVTPTAATATTLATTILASADPFVALAATVTAGNCWFHLSRRVGFNDMLDAYVSSAKRALMLVWGGVVLASVFGGSAGFFPAYVGPVWLGMGLAGLLKVFLNATAPTRFLCGIAEYPPEHGTYGSHATGAAHEYRLAVMTFDPEEKYRTWEKAKITMEFECDARIYRLMKMIGVYNELEEFEFEQERKKEMVKKAASKRREARKEEEGTRGWSATGPSSNAGPTTQGYIRDVSLAESMEAQLDEDNQRRQAKSKSYDAKVKSR